MKRIYPLILILSLLILAGCTSLENEIVDAWRDEDGIFIEFFENGTILITDEQGTNINGAYRFTSKDTIEINFSGELANQAGAQLMTVAIDDDTLTLTQGEDTLTLTR